MNLGEALSDAIGRLGRDPEPKSAPDTDRGLHARMNRLEKEHGSPAAAAAAVGVASETWGRWRKTGINERTGKPWQRPGKASLEAVTQAARKLYRQTFQRSVQQALGRLQKIRATAVINWDGYYNKQNGGYRGTNLDRLPRGSMRRLYPAWLAGDQEQLAGLFEAEVSQAYDGSTVNFEGDDVHIEWS